CLARAGSARSRRSARRRRTFMTAQSFITSSGGRPTAEERRGTRIRKSLKRGVRGGGTTESAEKTCANKKKTQRGFSPENFALGLFLQTAHLLGRTLVGSGAYD